MKKIFVIALILCGYFATAQNMDTKSVPSIVTAKFTSNYPSINDNKWGKVNMDNYETEFINNGIASSVLFDNKGNVLETVIVVKPIELPNPISDYIAKNYNWKKIREAEKVTDLHGKVSFRVGLGVKELELVFDYQGNFIRLSK